MKVSIEFTQEEALNMYRLLCRINDSWVAGDIGPDSETIEGVKEIVYWYFADKDGAPAVTP